MLFVEKEEEDEGKTKREITLSTYNQALPHSPMQK